MKLINRSSKNSPLARQACDAALASHVEKFGEYGHHDKTTTYTVLVEGVKITVEVVNRPASYVATALTGRRRIRSLVNRGINSEREEV